MKKKLLLIATTGLFSLFGIIGIQWGIPGTIGLHSFYSSPSDAKALLKGVTKEYVQDSWNISKTEEPFRKVPRSHFNIIRSFHPDEHNIIKSISNMHPKKRDFNPHFFEYPSCYIYSVAIFLKSLELCNKITLTPSLEYYFSNPRDMGTIYLAGRLLTFLYGAAAVILLFLTTSQLWGTVAGFSASALMIASPVFLLNSHYMAVDVPMVFWISLFFFLFVRFQQKKSRLLFLAACAALGFAASTKYPAITLLPLIFFRCAVPKQEKRAAQKDLLLGLLIILCAFFLASPYILLAKREFFRDFLYQIGARGMGSRFSIERFALSRFLVPLWAGHFLMLLPAFLGILLSLLRRSKKDILLLTAIICASLPLLAASGTLYARYFLLLTPFLSIAGASFIAQFQKKKIFLLFFWIFLSASLTKSLAYSMGMSRQDPRTSSAQWIEEKIPPHSLIAFTKDPWIFEVPPVNPFLYQVLITSSEKINTLPHNTFLVVSDLQWFTESGLRNVATEEALSLFQKKGYTLIHTFRNRPSFYGIPFDHNLTVHDMLYTHPEIFILQRQ
ncbi:MAG: phospholipid carrier-dependent glycosyltransferase [Candidatus Ratteibacteria bacterium]|jgi:hypothetical protein